VSPLALRALVFENGQPVAKATTIELKFDAK
jgi:hypothetical protein